MNDLDRKHSGSHLEADAHPSCDDVSVLTHGIGQLLRRAYYKAHEHSAQSVKPYDLTVRQAAAIRELAAHGAMSQAELGSAIGMEPANVHGLVERLKKKRLISAERDAGNPRRMRLSLTAEGGKMTALLNSAKLASESMTLQNLDVGEREILCRLLEKIIR